jgi:hypothetical protein
MLGAGMRNMAKLMQQAEHDQLLKDGVLGGVLSLAHSGLDSDTPAVPLRRADPLLLTQVGECLLVLSQHVGNRQQMLDHAAGGAGGAGARGGAKGAKAKARETGDDGKVLPMLERMLAATVIPQHAMDRSKAGRRHPAPAATGATSGSEATEAGAAAPGGAAGVQAAMDGAAAGVAPVPAGGEGDKLGSELACDISTRRQMAMAIRHLTWHPMDVYLWECANNIQERWRSYASHKLSVRTRAAVAVQRAWRQHLDNKLVRTAMLMELVVQCERALHSKDARSRFNGGRTLCAYILKKAHGYTARRAMELALPVMVELSNSGMTELQDTCATVIRTLARSHHTALKIMEVDVLPALQRLSVTRDELRQHTCMSALYELSKHDEPVLKEIMVDDCAIPTIAMLLVPEKLEAELVLVGRAHQAEREALEAQRSSQRAEARRLSVEAGRAAQHARAALEAAADGKLGGAVCERKHSLQTLQLMKRGLSEGRAGEPPEQEQRRREAFEAARRVQAGTATAEEALCAQQAADARAAAEVEKKKRLRKGASAAQAVIAMGGDAAEAGAAAAKGVAKAGGSLVEQLAAAADAAARCATARAKKAGEGVQARQAAAVKAAAAARDAVRAAAAEAAVLPPIAMSQSSPALMVLAPESGATAAVAAGPPAPPDERGGATENPKGGDGGGGDGGGDGGGGGSKKLKAAATAVTIANGGWDVDAGDRLDARKKAGWTPGPDPDSAASCAGERPMFGAGEGDGEVDHDVTGQLEVASYLMTAGGGGGQHGGGQGDGDDDGDDAQVDRGRGADDFGQSLAAAKAAEAAREEARMRLERRAELELLAAKCVKNLAEHAPCAMGIVEGGGVEPLLALSQSQTVHVSTSSTQHFCCLALLALVQSRDVAHVAVEEGGMRVFTNLQRRVTRIGNGRQRAATEAADAAAAEEKAKAAAAAGGQATEDAQRNLLAMQGGGGGGGGGGDGGGGLSEHRLNQLQLRVVKMQQRAEAAHAAAADATSARAAADQALEASHAAAAEEEVPVAESKEVLTNALYTMVRHGCPGAVQWMAGLAEEGRTDVRTARLCATSLLQVTTTQLDMPLEAGGKGCSEEMGVPMLPVLAVLAANVDFETRHGAAESLLNLSRSTDSGGWLAAGGALATLSAFGASSGADVEADARAIRGLNAQAVRNMAVCAAGRGKMIAGGGLDVLTKLIDIPEPQQVPHH